MFCACPAELSQKQLDEILRYMDEMLHVEVSEIDMARWDGGIVPMKRG